MARAVYGYLLLTLIYFYFTNSLVSQWGQPVLIYVETDNVYWLLHMLDIPQWILRSKTVSSAFDLLMFASVVLFLIYPNKRIFCLVSLICLWLFQIMYSSANGHIYHEVGYLIVPIPFLFRDKLKFYFCWELIRYWIIFLFTCSGLYKIYYKGFFKTMNLSLVMRGHFVYSRQRKLVLYLIEHPAVSQLLYKAATFLQLICGVGFFTHKRDKWILAALLAFNLGNLYLLNISFIPNGLVIAPFLPWNRIYLWWGKNIYHL
ncbi:MAG: hypothetical protein ACJ75B_16395 [Flavisolibacter sp.]